MFLTSIGWLCYLYNELFHLSVCVYHLCMNSCVDLSYAGDGKFPGSEGTTEQG